MLEAVKAEKSAQEAGQATDEQVCLRRCRGACVAVDAHRASLSCLQGTEELDITEKEGEFLTKESAEEKMARALSSQGAIRRVRKHQLTHNTHCRAADSMRSHHQLLLRAWPRLVTSGSS